MSYIGKTYGDFTVIALHSNNKSGIKYKCRCNLCGKDKILKQSDFWHNPMHSDRACEAKRVKAEKKPKITDPCGDRKGCIYWKRICGGGPFCCNFIDINGVSRPRGQDGECLGYSRQEKGTNESKRKRDF